MCVCEFIVIFILCVKYLWVVPSLVISEIWNRDVTILWMNHFDFIWCTQTKERKPQIPWLTLPGNPFFVNPILCNRESKTLIPEGRGSTQDHTVESKFMILSKTWILFTWEISFQLRFESPYSVLWVNPIFTLDGNKPNLGKFHPYFLPCIALDFTSDSLRSDFERHM